MLPARLCVALGLTVLAALLVSAIAPFDRPVAPEV